MSELEERKFANKTKSKDGKERLLPLNNIKNYMMFGLQKKLLLEMKQKSLPEKTLSQLNQKTRKFNQSKKLKKHQLLQLRSQ
jgi:hypothetical protein